MPRINLDDRYDELAKLLTFPAGLSKMDTSKMYAFHQLPTDVAAHLLGVLGESFSGGEHFVKAAEDGQLLIRSYYGAPMSAI